ncbi:AbrB/MazE/SpoVT family DNA-binding domain-containing protein [Pararhizobium mangrovi]|uniref:AbrB/MazE/SpoVT family DNA-binding domain-containing protein n=1 Tax=Pararhizobium mangrovi TaxID=2590452 RepID=A0A506UA62_9HYPH|nr:AbrB/MazE/SpoVT family DNA-binding domain-containing protein [Pararhizobium mangrovi]TPW29954.1 AbrB/MazE/SpoVT family DNA-binding domain-containing protein [Pararhizobium mangrovi]
MNEFHAGVLRRTIRVAHDADGQTLHIPKDWAFSEDEVDLIRNEDGSLRVEGRRARRTPKELVEWLRSQPPIEEDFPEIEDLPPEPVDLDPKE